MRKYGPGFIGSARRLMRARERSSDRILPGRRCRALRLCVGLVRSHTRAFVIIGSHRSGRTRLITRAVATTTELYSARGFRDPCQDHSDECLALRSSAALPQHRDEIRSACVAGREARQAVSHQSPWIDRKNERAVWRQRATGGLGARTHPKNVRLLIASNPTFGLDFVACECCKHLQQTGGLTPVRKSSLRSSASV